MSHWIWKLFHHNRAVREAQCARDQAIIWRRVIASRHLAN